MTPPTGISPPYHRGSPIHQARRCRTGRNRCRRGARSPPAPSPSRRLKRNRRCPLLPKKPMPRLTPGRAPTRASWVDLMAAGLAEPRCTSERGLAMGGGRPAERRFTVGGSSKSVARCHRSVLAYWKFESISLQRRVRRTSNHVRCSRFPCGPYQGAQERGRDPRRILGLVRDRLGWSTRRNAEINCLEECRRCGRTLRSAPPEC